VRADLFCYLYHNHFQDLPDQKEQTLQSKIKSLVHNLPFSTLLFFSQNKISQYFHYKINNRRWIHLNSIAILHTNITIMSKLRHSNNSQTIGDMLALVFISVLHAGVIISQTTLNKKTEITLGLYTYICNSNSFNF